MSLDRELAYYNRHKPEFLENEGKFVVIHGETVAGFWETYEDAIQVACREFGLEPFFIKKVENPEPIHYIRGLPVSFIEHHQICIGSSYHRKEAGNHFLID